MLWIDTPGVYFQWTDDRNRLAGEVRSDIAGFVGIAERGPLHEPLKVESWAQFSSLFGGYTPQGYLAYAVAGFFANGGSACWVVRVADPTTARAAHLDLTDANGRNALRLEATSPGIWGNRVLVRLIPEGQGRFALDLRLGTGVHEYWNSLTTAVSSLELLDARQRPTLRLVSYASNLWHSALTVRVLRQGDRFTLELETRHSSFEAVREAAINPAMEAEALSFAHAHQECSLQERFEDLTLDPDDARYAPRVLAGETPEKNTASKLVVAYDLFSTSSGADHLPMALEPYPLLKAGILTPEPRHVSRLLNHPDSGSLLVRVAEDFAPEAALHSHTAETPTADQHSESLPQEHLPEWLLEARAPQLSGIARLSGGQDGLTSLGVDHLSGSGDTNQKHWGLATLAGISEIGLVAMPDILPKGEVELNPSSPLPRCACLGREIEPAQGFSPLEFAPPFDDLQIFKLQSDLIQHCEVLKDRFALLDPPPELAAAQDVVRWRGRFDTSFAALYYPWLRVPDALRLSGLLRQVPPSGHIAGLIAATDLRVGVHKPPANTELLGVRELAVSLGEIDHGMLNRAQVNLTRQVAGRGLRLLGARTLSSDTTVRYVNVRRMLTMIVDALDKHLAWTVMEPNDERLWLGVERVARAFLDQLWRRGQLAGENRQQAFFVRCDHTTNPQEDVDQGLMTCQIGVYLPWPAEFVIVHVGRRQGPLEILDARRDDLWGGDLRPDDLRRANG